MNEEKVRLLCTQCFGREPSAVERCPIGLANYVYILSFGAEKAVLRLRREENAYRQTAYWLEKLAGVGVPVPRVLRIGRFADFDFILLSYIPGKDLGLVYASLTDREKRCIAADAAAIQEKAARLEAGDLSPDWSWEGFIRDMLTRADMQIRKNGWFDPEKVRRTAQAAQELGDYFASVPPVVYLDDITTKNLLIESGRVSGVIDVDEIGIGDRLTFAALTKMSLLEMGQDTDYVNYLLEAMRLSPVERKAMRFYTLLYCVDFMGERGSAYTDKQVPVNEAIAQRLNALYEQLYAEYQAE